jgi:drug/metabolite transporter (DMT)-like permease
MLTLLFNGRRKSNCYDQVLTPCDLPRGECASVPSDGFFKGTVFRMNDPNQRSIFAMLIAVASFSVMDAIMKGLGGAYPPIQVAALRGLTALPLVCIYVAWRGAAPTLLKIRWPWHVARGALIVIMLWSFTFGIKNLALTEAYTIYFVSPLFITILSVPFLGEKVKLSHWLSIGIGLVGVVIALRPDGRSFLSLGALAVLCSATCYACAAIGGRILSRTDSSESLVFWAMAMLALGAGALAIPAWVPLRVQDLWLLAGLAVTGFIGQVALTTAFRHGQASVIAPFEYTALAWSVALDWLFWQTTPDRFTLLGGGIVIASGLYMVRQEKNPVPALPP